jgi:hypothetical protein
MILVISCNDESGEPIHGGLVKLKEDKTEYTVMVDDNFHFEVRSLLELSRRPLSRTRIPLRPITTLAG